MKKRVLLIGDALQAGFNTVNPLMNEYQLRVFIDKPIKLSYEDENVERFFGALSNYDDVLLAVTGCDVVVVSNSSSRSGAAVVRLDNIRRATSQVGVKRVIYVDPHCRKRESSYASPEDSVAFNHWG